MSLMYTCVYRWVHVKVVFYIKCLIRQKGQTTVHVCCISGIANEKQKLYGVQFHPEVDLTDQGKSMLKNFVFEVVKLKGMYTMKCRESDCIEYIRETVGDHKVLVRNTVFLSVFKNNFCEIFPALVCISMT